MRRLSLGMIAVMVLGFAACQGGGAPAGAPQGFTPFNATGGTPTNPISNNAKLPDVTVDTCKQDSQNNKPLSAQCAALLVTQPPSPPPLSFAGAISPQIQQTFTVAGALPKFLYSPPDIFTLAPPASWSVECNPSKSSPIDVSNVITDDTLRSAIRTTLNLKADAPITYQDTQKLTQLVVQGQGTNGISNLSGLQCFTALTKLDLSENQISDLTPLFSLTALAYLELYSNKISDLTPLSSLTALAYLELDSNKISDLTPLATLVNLQTLYLDNNQISELKPLAALVNLQILYLDNNQISDLSPLVSNLGIGAGDLVDITGNPVVVEIKKSPFVSIQAFHFQALKLRGVTVIYGTVAVPSGDTGCAPPSVSVGSKTYPAQLADKNYVVTIQDATDAPVTLGNANKMTLNLAGGAINYTVSDIKFTPSEGSSFSDTTAGTVANGMITWPAYHHLHNLMGPNSSTSTRDTVDFTFSSQGNCQGGTVTVKRFANFPDPYTEPATDIHTIGLWEQIWGATDTSQQQAQLYNGSLLCLQTSWQYMYIIGWAGSNAPKWYNYQLTHQVGPGWAWSCTVGEIKTLRFTAKDPDFGDLDLTVYGPDVHSTYWEAVLKDDLLTDVEMTGDSGYWDFPLTWKPRSDFDVP